MPRLEGLWPENGEAWQVYQLLCGRTVREGQLKGWLLERLTADWELDRAIALLERLDVIVSVLSHTDATAQN